MLKCFSNYKYITYIMISYLYLFQLCKSQIIFYCNQQSNCPSDYYCDNTLYCSDCNLITPSNCDSIDSNCCSKEFLYQCNNNPYQCNLNKHSSTEIKKKNNLHVFLIIFISITLSYLSIGIIYNKYVKEKWIAPNYEFWLNLYGLVKDGIQFTMNNIK